ncbi:MAG: hypothetical protein EOO38_04080 [Cytophagaceae bacterium]|nr:MAG: hypothetical protein EOO38_04080 [Cytophagaceae bacterium]
MCKIGAVSTHFSTTPVTLNWTNSAGQSFRITSVSAPNAKGGRQIGLEAISGSVKKSANILKSTILMAYALKEPAYAC